MFTFLGKKKAREEAEKKFQQRIDDFERAEQEQELKDRERDRENRERMEKVKEKEEVGSQEK